MPAKVEDDTLRC